MSDSSSDDGHNDAHYNEHDDENFPSNDCSDHEDDEEADDDPRLWFCHSCNMTTANVALPEVMCRTCGQYFVEEVENPEQYMPPVAGPGVPLFPMSSSGNDPLFHMLSSIFGQSMSSSGGRSSDSSSRGGDNSTGSSEQNASERPRGQVRMFVNGQPVTFNMNMQQGGFAELLASMFSGGFGHSLENDGFGNLDDIITQIMASHPLTYSIPSASENFIANLPSHTVTDDKNMYLCCSSVSDSLLCKCGKNAIPIQISTCSICLSDFETGDIATYLPCQHLFHREECIIPWLKTSASCPVCRVSLVDSPSATINVHEEIENEQNNILQDMNNSEDPTGCNAPEFS